DPPINKVIESAKEHPIKQSFFNKIRPPYQMLRRRAKPRIMYSQQAAESPTRQTLQKAELQGSVNSIGNSVKTGAC
ncbi:hypothetical protein, partial [Sulfitobacter sp.]